jgi:hypothetical protein
VARIVLGAIAATATLAGVHARSQELEREPPQKSPQGEPAKVIEPFEKGGSATTQDTNKLDALVAASLRKKKIQPAPLCSDAVFFRRVYLDMIGTLPEAREALRFLANRDPGKREALIERLFTRKEFADYWALKWCDLLRVKAEFPINLWPNGVQAYHRWIRDAVRTNKPYDRFARALLTSSGSNFVRPQVNFYRAIQGQKPATIASAVALTFMGVRLARWPQDRKAGFEAFFSRVSYKSTAEWKEVIVFLDPAPTEPLEATFPDGLKIRIKAGEDPRHTFARWLTTPENPWFCRNIVNRIWSWLFGRGLIHEPDDIRPDNPAVHPEVLTYLEEQLVKSRYDLRHVFRLILNSRTYQQSPIPRSNHPEAEAMFAHYPVRRLDAEVLVDALCQISGTRERYTSAIPEPFTFIPEAQRTIQLADGSITSKFLEMFGRPSRDTGLESERNLEPTAAQRLHLLNSSHVQNKIERGWKLRQLIRNARGNRRNLCTAAYLTILSRRPTENERLAVNRYMWTKSRNFQRTAHDLIWALINSKEFLYRH